MSSLGLVFTDPARADFVVCNRGSTKALVAVTWNSVDGVRSRGWIQVQPGQCNSAIRTDIRNAVVGVYAETIGGGGLNGETRRCVIQFPTQPSWNIVGADDASRCRGRGRVMVGFRTVQTGGSPDYTYELYD